MEVREMKESRVKGIVITIFLFLIIAITAFIVLLRSQSDGERARRYKHKISGSESYLRADKFTPQIVLDKVKEYVKSNGFSGDDIEFVFGNDYPSNIDHNSYRFYVEQYYKNFYCLGYFLVDDNGEIVSSEGLKTAVELAEVTTDNVILRNDAIQIGKDYLSSIDYTFYGARAYIYRNSENQKLKVIYELRYNDQTIALYIDGITGKVIKELNDDQIDSYWIRP